MSKAEQLAWRLTEHDDPELYEAADLLMFEAAAFIHKQDAAIKLAVESMCWAAGVLSINEGEAPDYFTAIAKLREVQG